MDPKLLTKQQQVVLDLGTRKRIYLLVQLHQGIHLRDLERKSGMALGTLRHHLAYLHKSHLLRVEKTDGHIRYFTTEFSVSQRSLLALLRQQSIRRILLLFTLEDNPTYQEIVQFVGLSAGTITFHLKKLIARQIIKEHRVGKTKNYSLIIDKDQIVFMLLTHKESFVDKVLDNVAAMWDF